MNRKLKGRHHLRNKHSTNKQLTNLYGQAFIALDNRDGDLEKFCHQESSSYSPALSSEEVLSSCTKSHLLACNMETNPTYHLSEDEELVSPDSFQFIIVDGGALIHTLPSTTVQGKSFDEYFMKVVYPRMHHDQKRAARVGISICQSRTLKRKENLEEITILINQSWRK